MVKKIFFEFVYYMKNMIIKMLTNLFEEFLEGKLQETCWMCFQETEQKYKKYDSFEKNFRILNDIVLNDHPNEGEVQIYWKFVGFL